MVNNLRETSNIFTKQKRDSCLFVDLKEELRGFLETNDLPTELLINNNRWFFSALFY